MTTNLKQEIKKLEEKLGSLRAEQRLLEAQEKLQKEKVGSLLEDESLTSLIKTLQEKLVAYDLGLALCLNYKQNWVFLGRDTNSKDGLASFPILDLEDTRIFYGLVESYNQEITVDGIHAWLENALKVVDFLNKVKSKLVTDSFKVEFRSYDNAWSKLYFTLEGLNDYDCVLTVRRPYELKMSKRLTYDSEYSTIFFLGDGVSLETFANSQYIREEDYLGDFEQKLSVERSFRKFSEIFDVVKELEDKLATFYEAIEPKFN